MSFRAPFPYFGGKSRIAAVIWRRPGRLNDEDISRFASMSPTMDRDVALLGELGYVRMANRDGEMVWVSPLFWQNGMPVYPPVDLPPGEKRRAREAATNAAHNRYREAKQRERERPQPRQMRGFDE